MLPGQKQYRSLVCMTLQIVGVYGVTMFLFVPRSPLVLSPHMQCKTHPENKCNWFSFQYNRLYILAHWYYHLAWGFHLFHVLFLLSSRKHQTINLVICPTAKKEGLLLKTPSFSQVLCPRCTDVHDLYILRDRFHLIQIFSNSTSNY